MSLSEPNESGDSASGLPEQLSELIRQVGQEIREIADSIGNGNPIIEGQAAMVSLLRGNLDDARHALSRLTPDQLIAVSLTASMLSSLADEVAAGVR